MPKTFAIAGCAGNARLVRLAGAAVGAAFVCAGVTALAQRQAAPTAPGPARVTISAPDTTSFFGLTPQFAVSPDGRQVVSVATAKGGASSLWLRPVASSDARSLSGTEQASYPFWSSDNRYVGFFAPGKLMKIPVMGGPPAVVCDAPTGRGGAWNADNVIIFSSGINDPLRKVAAAGGAPSAVTVVDVPRENSHRWPQFLPDGKHFLFWAGAGTGPAQLKIASLDSADVVAMAPADSNGAYAAGYVFFGSRNALLAQPFDPRTLQKTGEAVRVDELLSGDAGSSFASFSVSTNGTLLFTHGSARGLLLTWFDRGGKSLGTLGAPGPYTNVALSPDDTRLAVSLTAGSPANRDVWILDVATGKATRITSDPAVDATPIWSPDGTQIAFSSQRAGPYQMYRTVSTGGLPEDQLLKADTATIATDWSPDGRHIAYTHGTTATGLDLWILTFDSTGRVMGQPFIEIRAPRENLEARALGDNAVFSPDGGWIAYQSNESGTDEVYVRPLFDRWLGDYMKARGIDFSKVVNVPLFPPPPRPRQVSVSGGTQPLWRGEGKELFFLAPDGTVMAATTTFTPQKCDVLMVGCATFDADTPHPLFPAAPTLVIRRAYAVTKDGQRFLIPVLDQSNPRVITAVANWTATITK